MIIKMLSDKSLVMTTPNSKLYQRESAVEDIRFLIPATFKGKDLTQFVFSAVYKDPANESHIEVLTAEEELRDDLFIVLHMPVDSKFTRMAGTNILMLNGTNPIEESTTNQVLNTGEISIVVEPVPDYFAFVPDDALNSISQKLIDLQRKADELAAIQEQVNQKAAKDLSYTDEGHVNLVDELGSPMGEGIDVLYQKQLDSKDDGETDLDDLDDITDATFVDLDG